MADDLLKTTIGDLLDRQAERFGGRDALIHVEHGVRYSYAEFRDECNRVAKGLIALGLQKGDHVGIWATNYPEWVVAQFATAKIGAILVTVNPSYRTHELEYLLKQSDASTLLLIDSFKTSDYVGMINELIPELRDAAPGDLRSSKFPRLQRVIFIGKERHSGMLQWSDLAQLGAEVSDDELARRQAACDPDDVINIQYTSGTTATASAACSARSAASPTPRRWSFRPSTSIRSRRSRPSRKRAAPGFTASRPCLSPSCSTPISTSSASPRCAPASWPARPARSR